MKRLFSLLAFLAITSTGCATAQADMRRSCTAVDQAGTQLTKDGAALMDSYRVAVHAAQAVECTTGDEPTKATCRSRVVFDMAKEFQPLVDVGQAAIQAQNELADAMNESKVCKAVGK